LASQWTALAEAALPNTVAPFAETKRLLRQKYALLMTRGEAGVTPAQPVTDQLAALGRQASREFPLDAAGVNALFADLGARLDALLEAEQASLTILKQSI
jgi:hypothetical protein